MYISTARRILILPVLLFLGYSASGQMGWNSQWMWRKGDDLANQPGSYGTLGVTAPTNNPPSRFEAFTWKDVSGNFWMYGGVNYDAAGGMHSYGDLWNYNVVNNEWTWIFGSTLQDQLPVWGTKGVASATNDPGSRRGSASWVDAGGNLWLFGGANSLGSLNDLWKYEPGTGLWTWVSGDNVGYAPGVYGTLGVPAPANIPPARYQANGWKDNAGNFWLFGGSLISQTVINDLWRYNPATNEWTWMGGSTVQNQNGVYGTQGVASTSNFPGARYEATQWTDEWGNFWLFGGLGYPAAGPMHTLNDLWKFDPSLNIWTWMKGSDAGGASATGLVGIPDPANTPGARQGGAGQADTFGNLWLAGGNHNNDLWEYDINTNIWNLVKNGASAAVYGTMGAPAPANIPGPRYGSPNWMDNNSRLYLFGGLGNDKNSLFGTLSDMWRLECSNPTFPVAPPWDTVICPGATYTYSVVQDPNVIGYTWSLPPGWTGNSNTNTITVTADTNSGLITVYSTNSCFVNSGPFNKWIIVRPLSTDTISQTICQGQSFPFNGANLTSPGMYNDTLVSAAGCDSILVLDLSVDTVYTPAVTAAITEGANPGCMDSLIEFTATGTHIGPAALFTWLVNQVPVATGSVYATQTLLTGDQVQVMVVDPDSACRTTGTSYSSSFSMIRVAKPASPLISLIGNVLVSSIPNVQWYGPNGLIAGASGQSYHPTEDGVYYAKQANPGCDSDPSNLLTIALLDVQEYDLNQVKIYPNPTKGQLVLDWGAASVTVKLRVFDVAGRPVFQDMVVQQSRKILGLESLPAGIYYLAVEDERGRMGTMKVTLFR